MVEMRENPADYISHDVRNKVQAAKGHAEYGNESVEDLMQAQAVDSFEKAYRRFERILYEENVFDDELIEEMNDTQPIYDEVVSRNVQSTVHSIESIRAACSENEEISSVGKVFEPIQEYGEVFYSQGADSLRISKKYGAMVSTKICDLIKHVGIDEEIYAEIGINDEGNIEGYIWDNGPGLTQEDIENTGKGSEIIETILEGEREGEFEEFERSEAEELSDELPAEEEDDIGALFRFEIPAESSLREKFRI